MEAFLWAIGIFLLVNAFVCLWRAITGPTVVDRVLAINVIGTKTLLVLAVFAVISGQGVLLDVALVYGLLNFVITIAAARFLETGRLRGEWS